MRLCRQVKFLGPVSAFFISGLLVLGRVRLNIPFILLLPSPFARARAFVVATSYPMIIVTNTTNDYDVVHSQ